MLTWYRYGNFLILANSEWLEYGNLLTILFSYISKIFIKDNYVTQKLN